MIRFVIKRLIQAFVVLLFISIVVFVAIRSAPGDPALSKMTSAHQNLSEEEFQKAYDAARKQMGLDRAMPVQYVIWLKDILRGDFGYSLRNDRKVTNVIGEKFPASLQLLFMILSVSLLISIVLSVIQAVRYKTKVDRIFFILSTIFICIPPFWLGLIAILIFAAKLGWLPSGGYIPFLRDPIGFLKSAIMPVLTIALIDSAIYSRYLRSDLVTVLSEDYIRMAEAKGLSKFDVVIKHGLRNSLISFLTIVGMNVGQLLGGLVIIEQVFQWPGIGWLLFNAISNRDYPVVQGIVLVLCSVIVIMSLVVDVSYYFLNPKMREEFMKINK